MENSMSFKLKNIERIVKELFRWIKQRFKGPSELLQAGRAGGMILCALLAAQFIYGSFLSYIIKKLPSFVLFAMGAVVVALITEVVCLLAKIVFGGAKRSKVYFVMGWLVLFSSNFMANQSHALLPAVIMSAVMTLAVDVFGRCIVGIIRTNNYQQIFGYIACGSSLAVIVLFGVFFHMDNLGKNRMELYCMQKPGVEHASMPGFSEYLKNGTEKVQFLSYGPDKKQDICIPSIDLSSIEKREGIADAFLDMFSTQSFQKTPVAGAIWYPQNRKNCPVLFIAHGAHDSATPSYLGYDYIGEYLASNGYVVVSVDENIINEFNAGNDVRAVLLLENIKAILLQNEKKESLLYQRMNSEKIAIAGHSRGGEMVATAYLFNELNAYPENGNITFDYHFDISAIIAIAPTVDQYMPAGHAVEISDVNYLLMHGMNDQDVTVMMGEKQYNNVIFTEESKEFYYKSSVYIMGANHGQFNSRWGRYDLTSGTNGFLNTADFLKEAEQKKIAKAYIRTFLDRALNGDETYAELLKDNTKFLQELPKTVYITNYKDSSFEDWCSFDDSVDLCSGNGEGIRVSCKGMESWKLRKDISGGGREGENSFMECFWEKGDNPVFKMEMPETDILNKSITFRMADMRERTPNQVKGPKYTIELSDINGNTIRAAEPQYVYPGLALQLYKQDVLFGSYEYKHQMQTVFLNADMFEACENFDFSKIGSFRICFDGEDKGNVIIDDFGICSRDLKGN